MQLKGKIDKRRKKTSVREMKTQQRARERTRNKKARRLKLLLTVHPENEASLTFNCENKSHTNSSECIQFFMQDSSQRQEKHFPSKVKRWKTVSEAVAKSKRDENKWNRFCVVARTEIFI